MRKFIDFPSKPRTLKAMQQYLADHPRRYGWIGGGDDGIGLCHNVKFSQLHLTGAERDACYNLYGEDYCYQAAGVTAILEAFDKDNAPYTIYQAGRSAGYFVLRYNGQFERGPVWASAEDLEYSGDVRGLAAVVYAFDVACNEAVAAFVDYAVTTAGEAERE